MDGESFLVRLCNQRYHLVMVVETLQAMVAGLISVILVLPARMRLGHTVDECLCADNMEIFAADRCALCGDAGDLRLRVINVVKHIHIGIGAQLQLAFLLQLIVCLGGIPVDNLRAGIAHSSKSVFESEILPCEQIGLGILNGSGNTRKELKYRCFTDISVRFAVLVYMYLVIAVFLRILRVNAGPFQSLGIEQAGMSAAGLHEKGPVRANLIQKCFRDRLVILVPS